jgi:hypothetical protein
LSIDLGAWALERCVHAGTRLLVVCVNCGSNNRS